MTAAEVFAPKIIRLFAIFSGNYLDRLPPPVLKSRGFPDDYPVLCSSSFVSWNDPAANIIPVRNATLGGVNAAQTALSQCRRIAGCGRAAMGLAARQPDPPRSRLCR